MKLKLLDRRWADSDCGWVAGWSVSAEDGKDVYLTKGDNNNVDDRCVDAAASDWRWWRC